VGEAHRETKPGGVIAVVASRRSRDNKFRHGNTPIFVAAFVLLIHRESLLPPVLLSSDPLPPGNSTTGVLYLAVAVAVLTHSWLDHSSSVDQL
jgi:hypothetical protein